MQSSKTPLPCSITPFSAFQHPLHVCPVYILSPLVSCLAHQIDDCLPHHPEGSLQADCKPHEFEELRDWLVFPQKLHSESPDVQSKQQSPGGPGWRGSPRVPSEVQKQNQ